MSGIFGFVNMNGAPVARSVMETMRLAMAQWGAESCDVLVVGSAGLGRLITFSENASAGNQLPVHALEGGGRLPFSAAGRVDNRKEILRLTGIGINEPQYSDSELILRAYLKWGEDGPAHIYGDWSFAAWHPRERKLFLARDHFGNSALYYYSDPRIFAFASSRKALLALNLAPKEMDELYLAQVLVSWPAYHGERTIHAPIKRLPPAHCLTVTPERTAIRRYWRLEETPELRLTRREDYLEAFRGIFDEAVRCRLRSTQSIAASLSGGLDSGSVAATAAVLLNNENRCLLAFTSTPISDTACYLRNEFGDEAPFASSTAKHAGNIDLHRITAEKVSPIQAIRQMLPVLNEPTHAAGNVFWLHALQLAARAHGCHVFLTGQTGNAGISWTGSPLSQSLAFQIRHLGWRRWSREIIKHYTPHSVLDGFGKLRKSPERWWRNTAINPELVRRLNLWEGMRNDPCLRPRTPREMRCSILKPGGSILGSIHAQTGAAHGLEIRDPTADARVLAFTFSVPDHIFIDPETGMDRWLIRAAMKGRLPDDVRLNRRRGRQAADLVPRLRACAGEVETALDELASGPAAAYLDVTHMREVWRMIQRDDTPEAFRKSVTVLTRGIMAGLWVNGFCNAS